VTPDRESGDTVVRRGVDQSPADPDDAAADGPRTDLGTDPAADLACAAREAAIAAAPVPTPRPEVLARVLDGLRDLPAARRAPRGDGAGSVDDRAMPLPRRRT
jgi:hypothetical protein